MPGSTQQVRRQRRAAPGLIALVIVCLGVVSLLGACTESPEEVPPPDTTVAVTPAATKVVLPTGVAAGSTVGEQARTPPADATLRNARQSPPKAPQVPTPTPMPQPSPTAILQPPVVPARVSTPHRNGKATAHHNRATSAYSNSGCDQDANAHGLPCAHGDVGSYRRRHTYLNAHASGAHSDRSAGARNNHSNRNWRERRCLQFELSSSLR